MTALTLNPYLKGEIPVDLTFLKEPAMIWFLIGLVLIVAEFAAPGVVIIFFGLGAWAAALAVLAVEMSLFFQIVIFLVVSITTLLALRKRFVAVSENTPDMTDEFIGKQAEVEQPIARGAYGQVKFKGALWKAETTSDQVLEKGTMVEIVGYESIILKVKPVTE
jgi:membrane protein implicated in regulation of membrane protease activity